MKRALILLCGKSGCGKTSVANELVKRGLTQVSSYTTRDKRSDDENGHTFVSVEDFPFNDLVAYTFFNNQHYGATQQQCDEADIYVVDKQGIIELKEKYKSTRKVITVMLYTSEEELVERMLKRGDSDEVIHSRIINDIKEFANIHLLADYTTENIELKDTSDYIYDIWVDNSFDLKREGKA